MPEPSSKANVMRCGQLIHCSDRSVYYCQRDWEHQGPCSPDTDRPSTPTEERIAESARDRALKKLLHVVDDNGPRGSWIRRATRKDFASFNTLWQGFVIDEAKRGGQIAWEERVMAAFYAPLFWAYVNHERPGICLLAGIEETNAVLLWGATLVPTMVTLRDDPVAQGWGVYVNASLRGTGISKRLRAAACKELRDLGFKRVYGSVMVPEPTRKAVKESRPEDVAALESALGAGFQWEEISGSLYL